MKVIAIVGYHNTGKTTLAERLVNMLKSKGLRVGYLKHDPKGHGKTDRDGSDTYRLFRVADRVALLSPDRLTLWERHSDDPLEVVREHFRGFDVVILEGFKSLKGIPKVALGRVEAEDVVMRVEGTEEAGHIIELLENMEDNL